jgi:hypothetical protein
MDYNNNPDCIHGRFFGFGAPASWIAADILVMEEGVLVEHWDVIQDEATRAQSKSGNPMFAVHSPDRHPRSRPLTLGAVKP